MLPPRPGRLELVGLCDEAVRLSARNLAGSQEPGSSLVEAARREQDLSIGQPSRLLERQVLVRVEDLHRLARKVAGTIVLTAAGGEEGTSNPDLRHRCPVVEGAHRDRLVEDGLGLCEPPVPGESRTEDAADRGADSLLSELPEPVPTFA